MYFGLVLAGATPQVLASAAMSRSFDVRDEIEVKDDLDKKPDDDRSPVAASVQIYLEDIEYFLSSLGRLRAKGKFDPAKDTFKVAQSTLLPCVDSNLAGRYTPIRFESTSESSRSALEYFSRGMVYGYSLGDCVVTSEFKATAVDSRYSFKLDAGEFAIDIAVRKQTPQRAADLQRELQSTIALYAAKADRPVRKQIIERTTFRIENDQLLLGLHLPRAGLDALLANSAK